MITVMTQAALPTARAIRWRPLGVLAVLALFVALASRDPQRPADAVLAAIAAGLASGAVAALHDPADPVLAALPVSRTQRRVVRLALLGLPLLTLWWVIGGLTAASTEELGPGPLLALASAGVAVAVWSPGPQAVLVGASVPVAWLAADRLFTEGGAVADALAWWRTEAWLVTAVAALVCVAGSRRR